MKRVFFVVAATLALLGVAVASRWRSPKPTPPPQLAATPAQAAEPPDLLNPTAYLPPQCYAKTAAPGQKRLRNGCFACHQQPRAPNFTEDADLQTNLTFARAATENRWTNVLQPPAPAVIDDAALLAYVRADNYFDTVGKPKSPAAWDKNGDGRWEGFTPDCWFHTDARGFDRGPDGSATGWRAYAFAPFPGQFWPTNGGSAGDAFIRLPPEYRQDAAGRPSEAIYALNLAIVEAMIRRTDVPITATDEAAVGVDLDGDGQLGMAQRVAYVWPPRPGRPFRWVGRAGTLDRDSFGWPVAGLFPRGTEFLHSLRYLDVDGGRVRMAARMKELRYARKVRWRNYSQLEALATDEAREKQRRPDRLKRVLGDPERGVGTGTGWLIQGFIEDAAGELRPQTIEETAFCIGCHGGTGSTTDSMFSFARKLADGSPDGGWYHPDRRDVAAVPEPRRADGTGEYAHWLAQVGAGDEYGANDEVLRRFFRPDGSLRPAALRALEHDISSLILPSPDRALALDRAYLAVVRAQQFVRGREVPVGRPPRLHARVEQGASTGIAEPISPAWALAVGSGH